jgi:hypothetical protein
MVPLCETEVIDGTYEKSQLNFKERLIPEKRVYNTLRLSALFWICIDDYCEGARGGIFKQVAFCFYRGPMCC